MTKEAAGSILMDDNFATIGVAAVEEGRVICNNHPAKFIRFLLSCNTGGDHRVPGHPPGISPAPEDPFRILWVNPRFRQTSAPA